MKIWEAEQWYWDCLLESQAVGFVTHGWAAQTPPTLKGGNFKSGRAFGRGCVGLTGCEDLARLGRWLQCCG